MTDTGAPVERTLVLLKPDAVARGMMGRVLTRFEDALLKVVGSKMVWMDADLTRKHYFDLEERFAPASTTPPPPSCSPARYWPWSWRASTRQRRSARSSAPPTRTGRPRHHPRRLRDQNKAYATANGIAVANLVHASGNIDEAKQEVALWFPDEELFEYSTVAEKFVL